MTIIENSEIMLRLVISLISPNLIYSLCRYNIFSPKSRWPQNITISQSNKGYSDSLMRTSRVSGLKEERCVVSNSRTNSQLSEEGINGGRIPFIKKKNPKQTLSRRGKIPRMETHLWQDKKGRGHLLFLDGQNWRWEMGPYYQNVLQMLPNLYHNPKAILHWTRNKTI